MQTTAGPGHKHTVEVWAWEVGLPSGRYSSGKKRFNRAPIEPLVCLLDFPGIEAAKVTIRGHDLTVYRTWDGVWNFYDSIWTSSREDATRHARRRDDRSTITPP